MFWRKKRIYLDYAAGVSGNPSSPHEEGRLAKKMLEDARTTIARLIEVQSDDIIFTSGATESNALAILGHMRALKAVGKKDMHILYLPSAHASIVENAKLREVLCDNLTIVYLLSSSFFLIFINAFFCNSFISFGRLVCKIPIPSDKSLIETSPLSINKEIIFCWFEVKLPIILSFSFSCI